MTTDGSVWIDGSTGRKSGQSSVFERSDSTFIGEPTIGPGPDAYSTAHEREASLTRSEEVPALRILFDINHPAQVHLFHNAIRELEARGCETLVTSREKEVTVDLLEAFDIEHRPLTVQRRSTAGLAWELCCRESRLLGVAREFDPDVIVSRLGPPPAHVSTVIGCPNVVVSDTLASSGILSRLYRRSTLPFVDVICAPVSFDLPVEPERRRSLELQELAYLHPRYFEPEPSVLEALGIDPFDPYFVLRLAGWDAYHDVGHTGLSPGATRELVSFLSDRGEVYLSAEDSLPSDLESHRLPVDPAAIHQVLYHADLYVGDSGTMSTEAAVLGTPAIRTNSMVGERDEPVFRTLEEEYGLLQSFRNEWDAVAAARALLSPALEREAWRERRERLVEAHPDVTERMVDIILEEADTS